MDINKLDEISNLAEELNNLHEAYKILKSGGYIKVEKVNKTGIIFLPSAEIKDKNLCNELSTLVLNKINEIKQCIEKL